MKFNFEVPLYSLRENMYYRSREIYREGISSEHAVVVNHTDDVISREMWNPNQMNDLK